MLLSGLQLKVTIKDVEFINNSLFCELVGWVTSARIHSGAVLLRGGRSRPSLRGGAPLTDVTATAALHCEAVSKLLRNEALSNVSVTQRPIGVPSICTYLPQHNH